MRFNLLQSFNYTPYLFYKNALNQGPYTERIDLWFELFFEKEWTDALPATY